MEFIYPYAKLIHILLVIVFLGYVFFDVVIFSAACKNLDKEDAKKAKLAIGQRAIRIMPLALLFIFLSGGMMMSLYLGSQKGYFDTSLQQFLVIKVILAMIIIFGVILNLSRKFLKKEPLKFMKNFHTFVLIVGFIIVVLAKMMFFV